MIDRDELKSFCVFLETANDRELNEREKVYAETLDVLTRGSDARRDFQFLLRKLREEKAARLNLRWLEATRKARLG